MSGGIEIRPHVCWLKAGWLAEYVADEVRSNCGAAVAARLSDIGKWPGAIGDFCSASPEEMQDLYRATVKLRDKMQAAGPTSFRDPLFFPGALNAVTELVTLLREDPRTSSTE